MNLDGCSLWVELNVIIYYTSHPHPLTPTSNADHFQCATLVAHGQEMMVNCTRTVLVSISTYPAGKETATFGVTDCARESMRPLTR